MEGSRAAPLLFTGLLFWAGRSPKVLLPIFAPSKIRIESVIDVRRTKILIGLEALFLTENEFGLSKPLQT
jgi:hypothetical protein